MCQRASNFTFPRLKIHQAYLDRAAWEQLQELQWLFCFVEFVVFSYFTHSCAGFRGGGGFVFQRFIVEKYWSMRIL